MAMAMNHRGEAGVALIVALLTMVLMMALGAALVLITSTESAIAANFRAGHEAFYAADAVFEWALADLRSVPDFTTVLDGTRRSSFADGSPSGIRRLTDGSTIDLTVITNIANCDRPAGCTDAAIAAATSDRPWGANNPRWTLYAYGRLADVLGPSTVSSSFYVVAFVGDDPSENDGDPTKDGDSAGQPNPGRGIVAIRAEAFGPRNAHRLVEATVARIDTTVGTDGGDSTDLRIISWREVR
jgi:PilX N-terminal